jgi:hypothetical protein
VRVLKLRRREFHGIHLFTGTQILDANILLTQYRKALEIALHVMRRGEIGSRAYIR